MSVRRTVGLALYNFGAPAKRFVRVRENFASSTVLDCVDCDSRPRCQCINGGELFMRRLQRLCFPGGWPRSKFVLFEPDIIGIVSTVTIGFTSVT